MEQLLLTISSQDYDDFQGALRAAEVDGSVFRDEAAHDPNLYSDIVHRLLVDGSALASAPSLAAIVIAYIRSRRVRVTIQDPASGASLEYDGPQSAITEVKKLVERSRPDELP